MGKLVLTRTLGQTICIGDDVQIEVARVRGNKVSLAITAPDDVKVDRKEIRDKPGYKGFVKE